MIDDRVTISKERYAELIEKERHMADTAIVRACSEEKWAELYADAEKWRAREQSVLIQESPHYAFSVSADEYSKFKADAELGALVRQMPEFFCLGCRPNDRGWVVSAMNMDPQCAMWTADTPEEVLSLALKSETAGITE